MRAAIAALCLAGAIHDPARAQTSGGSGGAIDLGARSGVVGASSNAATTQEGLVEFSARAGIASDYVYRGTTLSARNPAAGAAFEAALSSFYVNGAIATVRLPSRPAAEVSLGGGIRPKLGEVQFDLGLTAFLYPAEAPPAGVAAGISYWEATARADTRLGELLRLGAGFAYAPNVSNTGAWSKYAALGLGIDVPRNVLPQDIAVALTAGSGYSWFGNQSAALGGFPLPAYLNWNAGVTFTRKNLNLDLRYHDTNLSKEDCFVFTGDPDAVPTGRIDPVTNPQGLASRWCGAAIVAKFWFALN